MQFFNIYLIFLFRRKTYYHVLTERFNDVNGGWIRLFNNTAYTQNVDNSRSYENIVIPFMNLQYACEFYCAQNGQFNGSKLFYLIFL